MFEVVDKPEIQIISYPSLEAIPIQNYLEARDSVWKEDSPAFPPERLCEYAGRFCYDAFGSKQGRTDNFSYLQNIITSGHHSVLEHPHWSFMVCGVSRSLTHELIRHRHISISQESQRYVGMDHIRFVRPFHIFPDTETYTLWIESCKAALASYEEIGDNLEMLFGPGPMNKSDKRKHMRQAARSVLPNCTETRFVMTANARTLRHIITLRGGPGAEVEIRRFAYKLLAIMYPAAPNFFYDFKVEEHDDGVPIIICTNGVEPKD